MKYLTLCAAEMSIPRQCVAVDLNALLCGSNHLLHGQTRDDSAVVEGAEGSERVLHGVRVPCLRRATLAAGRLAGSGSLRQNYDVQGVLLLGPVILSTAVRGAIKGVAHSGRPTTSNKSVPVDLAR
eukprot:COSAG01_NODE_26264_length_719_cov_1.288710_1_plen_126_part_00